MAQTGATVEQQQQTKANLLSSAPMQHDDAAASAASTARVESFDLIEVSPEEQVQAFKRVYNFASGPSCLPIEVLLEAQEELLNWRKCGMSVLELSHRGRPFLKMFEETKQQMERLLNIPQTHKLLFMTGGATAQFAALPLNWLRFLGDTADYIVSGYWSCYALKEASKFGGMRVAADNTAQLWTTLPPVRTWSLNPEAAYVHYCDNETMWGLEFPEVPDLNEALVATPTYTTGTEILNNDQYSKQKRRCFPAEEQVHAKKSPCSDSVSSRNSRAEMRWKLVCDMSSNICSRPIDFEKFSLIYAGAQKNCGPAGVTLVVAQRDMLEKKEALALCPTMMNYNLHFKADSMVNAGPVFNIYVVGLMARYMWKRGDLSMWNELSLKKSSLLYEAIENSEGFYMPTIPLKSERSRMTVCFRVCGNSPENRKAAQEGCTYTARCMYSNNDSNFSNSEHNNSKTCGLVSPAEQKVEIASGRAPEEAAAIPKSGNFRVPKVGEMTCFSLTGAHAGGPPTGCEPASSICENKALTEKFLSQAKAKGFHQLNGHRRVGGCRAALFSGMPLEAVEKLAIFMKEFAEENSET